MNKRNFKVVKQDEYNEDQYLLGFYERNLRRIGRVRRSPQNALRGLNLQKN